MGTHNNLIWALSFCSIIVRCYCYYDIIMIYFALYYSTVQKFTVLLVGWATGVSILYDNINFACLLDLFMKILVHPLVTMASSTNFV